MKRTYISPEFKYNKVNGTFNMLEEKTFFGSKMLEIEDIIDIDNTDIIYYQKSNGEQINEVQEKLLTPVIYSSNTEKQRRHSLVVDNTQSNFDKINNSKWILKINIKELLRDYIYAKLKNSRSFEGIINANTRKNSINQSVYDYIDQNIMDRYTFSNIKLYIKYNSLLESGNYQSVIDNNNQQEFTSNNGNKWDTLVNVDSNIENKIQTDITFDDIFLNVKFKQAKIRSEYNFNYYFDIIFKKL